MCKCIFSVEDVEYYIFWDVRFFIKVSDQVLHIWKMKWKKSKDGEEKINDEEKEFGWKGKEKLRKTKRREE